MDKSYKILWYEGMNLEPHHFQQWDRFIENNVNFRIKAINAHDWGLTAISIDEDALTNGNFKLLNCKGIMPDGFAFQLPEMDSLPPFRAFVDQFGSTQQNLGVYLTLSSERSGGQNYSLDDTSNKRNTRFYLDQININDENTGSGEREIGIARADFKIMFESESLEDLSAIKIAEIVRSAEGEFGLSKEYIAPCLSISASDNLVAILRRLFELLIARSNALRKRRRQLPDGNLEMTPGDMPIFWLLFTTNAYIPALNQFLSDGTVHPGEVYHSLLSLTGQLTTFSSDDSIVPQEFPLYDHTDSVKGFLKIEEYLMQLLGDITPAKNYLQIELEKKGETIFVGPVKDSSVMKDYKFFLVCSSETSDENLVNDLPAKLRVASPDMIKQILSSATPALPIKYIPRPPAGVPVKPQSYYFRLEKDEKFWKPIENSQAIVIYKPSEFKEIDIELIAVKTSD
jgi:type VI secretion system protein ImpJ